MECLLDSRVISMEISVFGLFFDQKSQMQRVEFEVAILSQNIPMIYKPPPCPTDFGDPRNLGGSDPMNELIKNNLNG